MAGNGTSRPDFFAGLQLTDDQKAKIDLIHKDTRSRMDAVEHDEKLNADAKGAMLDGYRRLENGKIFEVLTPEQQREVRKRASAWRAATRPPQSKSQSPQQ